VDIFTQGDIYGLIGVYGYVIFVILFARIMHDYVKNSRKIVHILTGGIVFFWWLFDTDWVMAGLAAFPFIPILLFTSPASPIKGLRESSVGDITSRGHPYGLVMYAISWTIIAYFLFNDLFAASIAIASMSFGDGMGDLIGRKFGKLEYVPHRTVEGSIAVFAATTISIIIIGWFYFDMIGYTGGTIPEMMPLFAVGIGGFVTCLEAITPGKIDNLVIPLVVAGFLHTLGV